MSILKSFFKDLNYEESIFVPIISSDNLGLLMRIAINELDWYYYNYSRTPNPSEEQQEQLYIMELGVTRLIKIALQNRESFDLPVVTTLRRPDLAIKVLSISSALGIIQHGRRVAQTIANGVGEIEKAGPKEYKIVLPEEIEDDDFYERSVLTYHNGESRRRFAEAFRCEKWTEIEKDVNKKLSDLVFPFMRHYIGYGADPILDDYFFGLAAHEISLQEGYDTYHYAVEFGGIRFQNYLLALKFLVAHSIRHQRFAEALVIKSPQIKLENILTISADIDPFVESLCDAVNYFGSAYEGFEAIRVDQARKIFNVLTYGRENLELIDAPGSPFPPSIKCSETGVIRALFGAHSEPVRYLLESLRFHFPQDYDKNQAGREFTLQRAVQRVIDEGIAGVTYLKNVKMRLNGKVLSDIDLVAMEQATGTIIFFQLKHQELYGSDLHARSIRNKRLKNQVVFWMNAVVSWESALKIEGIKRALQLPKAWPQDIQVYRIVVSRHYAYVLKRIVADENSAFSSWPQFFNATHQLKQDCRMPTLKNLFAVLREAQQKNKVTYLQEPTTKWKIHELVFTTTQGGSECI